MNLTLVVDESGRLLMVEHPETRLLVFRHEGEDESAFLDRVRDQLGINRDSA